MTFVGHLRTIDGAYDISDPFDNLGSAFGNFSNLFDDLSSAFGNFPVIIFKVPFITL